MEKKDGLSSMKKYIGTKMIKARAMNRGDYNKYRGWDTPADENPADEGYLVRSPDKDGEFSGPLDSDCDHIAWLPTDQFTAMACMSFGLAIEAMKAGHKVYRLGWNGKNMFVVYQKGYPNGIPCNAQTAKAYGIKEGDLFKCRPYMQMRCADGSCEMWLPSQSDCLEEDWTIVCVDS